MLMILVPYSIVRKLCPPKLRLQARDHYRIYRSRIMKRTRLKEDQTRYIIRQRQKGTAASVLAQTMQVSARHIRRIWAAYPKTRTILPHRKPGRPRKTVSSEDVRRVLKIYDDIHAGVVRTARLLRKSSHISYHTVYQIMKSNGLARLSPEKSKKRKYVRYERLYSNAMWHVDWHVMKDPRLKGLQLVAYLDDASRCITGFGLFDSATSQNTVAVLRKAIKSFGTPDQILSDNGAQFTSRNRGIPAKG